MKYIICVYMTGAYIDNEIEYRTHRKKGVNLDTAHLFMSEAHTA